MALAVEIPTAPRLKLQDSEAKRLAREFESVQRELETQREQNQRAYRERNEVIRRATEAGSAQQEDLFGSQRAAACQRACEH